MQDSKPTFTDLNLQQRLEFGDGCTFVPDFIFTANCRHHDFNYVRGGGLKDKLKADWDMCRLMWSDSSLWWHYAITIIYWLGLTFLPISYFAFYWSHQYNDIQTILMLDEKSKEKQWYK